jgi:hypothetical protein
LLFHALVQNWEGSCNSDKHHCYTYVGWCILQHVCFMHVPAPTPVVPSLLFAVALPHRMPTLGWLQRQGGPCRQLQQQTPTWQPLYWGPPPPAAPCIT